MSRTRVTWIALMFFVGCDSDNAMDAGPDSAAMDAALDSTTPTGAETVFAPSESGPVRFLSAPFPSDLYLDTEGHVAIDFAGHPAYVANMAIELGRRTAFCRICNVSFPLNGALDRDTVPADAAPDAVATPEDPIVLMRADGVGGPLPLQVDYDEPLGLLNIRPRYGIVLDPGARYVAAVTDAIDASDGTPLQPSAMFATLRDGGAPDAAGERARPVVEEALAALEAAGIGRERVVTATVFTTEGDVGLLREIDAVSNAAATPTITVDRIWTEAELDDLYGQPTDDRPGVDIPSADGLGTQSTVHDAIAYIVTGHFTGPRIVGGSGGDIGLLRRDETGTLTAGPELEQIPYVLMVPKDVPLADLPIVLVHHGNPGNMTFAMHHANTFAREGMAVFGYNMFQMAGRTETSVDEENQLRFIDGPDGLLDQPASNTTDFRTLGLVGAAPGEENRFDHYLAFAAQASLDVTTAIRLFEEADLTPIEGAEPALTGMSFDPDQIYYFGQSFGAQVGMGTLPLLAGKVQAAVLTVGPPDFPEHSCNSPANRGNFEAFAVTWLGLRAPFETIGRRLSMTPVMDLPRWMLQPVSPVHTLHFALDAPILDGEPPDLLINYGEFDESVSSPAGEHVLGVAGVGVSGNAYYIAPPALAVPATANRETPNGTITAGGWIWPSSHSLVSLVDFTVDYEVPFFPPFPPIAEPRSMMNPVVQAHRHMSHFFQTHRTSGRSVIVNPATL